MGYSGEVVGLGGKAISNGEAVPASRTDSIFQSVGDAAGVSPKTVKIVAAVAVGVGVGAAWAAKPF